MTDSPARRISFLGIRTDKGAELRAMFEDVLGLHTFFENDAFVALRMPGGDVVEIFSADDPAHAHFDTGPMAGFEVDDLDAASRALEGAGIERLGEITAGGAGSRWLHFRGPDGNVYELLQTGSG